MLIINDPVPMAVDSHGMVRIAGTRVTLDTVIACYQQGYNAEAIVDGFPTLSLADVHAVISYYLRHQEEVEQYLKQNDHKADELRRAYEAKFGKQPTRAELEERYRRRYGVLGIAV
jgi:uncharacterized protein (DUF433 family)